MDDQSANKEDSNVSSVELVGRVLDGFDMSGFDDGEYLVEGLERVSAAVAAEEGLTSGGRETIARYLRMNLDRLAMIRADRRRFREIASETIKQPVFIMGPPRAGTTYLHSLLAQDPESRTPLGWEVAFPSPPPQAESYDHDPRIEKWVEMNGGNKAEAFHGPAAESASKHKFGALLPEECGYIFGSTMRGNDIWAMLRSPDYMNWMLFSDMEPAYRIHREWLQHLQWRNPRSRWVLKSPPHAFFLSELKAVYPDARLIQNHRDPAALASSLASLIGGYRQFNYGHVDRHALGFEILHMLGIYVSRALVWRKANPHQPVFDVGYRDLTKDPLGTVRRIYSFLGLPLSPQAEVSISAYIAANPQSKHGEHKHRLGDYGLNEKIVREKLADYVAAYESFF